MESLKGVIRGFSLKVMLPLLETNSESVSLHIASHGRKGVVTLDQGHVIAARTQDLTCQEALLEICSWRQTEITIHPLQDATADMDISPQIFILQRNDEIDGKGDIDSKEIRLAFDSGCHQLASGAVRSAADTFRELLGKYPRHPQGWMQLSRCYRTAATARRLLANAALLAPDCPEIAQERNRLSRGEERIGERGVRHCPFCWELLTAEESVCPACLGCRDIPTATSETVASRPLEQGLRRMQKLYRQSPHVRIGYHLAVGNCRLGRHHEALEWMQQIRTLTGEHAALEREAHRLTAWAATREEGEMGPPPAVLKRILVVEDSLTAQQFVRNALAPVDDVELVIAGNGLEAFERMNDRLPDLMFLDIILPGMSGYQILAAMKRNDAMKEIPVVMLTSRDDFISRMKGRMGGASGYLAKPFDPLDLVGYVERFLEL